jgi:hypothetical protein
MKNFITAINRNTYTSFVATAILFLINANAFAQIPANAINADPSAKAITQVPLGVNINGTAVMKFRFTNEASSVNATGQIPANSIRLTISFPGTFAYRSINSIPKFAIEDAETTPYGVVHLVNNALILEGEVLDLQLNVLGTASGNGTVTFNADRTTPIIVANVQTANDNSSATFNTTGVLPLKLLSFNAQKQNCNANLSWLTTEEVNFDHFEVQMSDDAGASYNTIGNVPASTVATGDRRYNFSSLMQNSNAHLYRLKIIDKKGDFTYSYIVRINSGCSTKQDDVLVYPSPATKQITVNVSDQLLYNTKATIIDVNGRDLISFMVTGTVVKVDINNLTAGMYIIRFSDGSTAKFMKNQ